MSVDDAQREAWRADTARLFASEDAHKRRERNARIRVATFGIVATTASIVGWPRAVSTLVGTTADLTDCQYGDLARSMDALNEAARFWLDTPTPGIGTWVRAVGVDGPPQVAGYDRGWHLSAGILRWSDAPRIAHATLVVRCHWNNRLHLLPGTSYMGYDARFRIDCATSAAMPEGTADVCSICVAIEDGTRKPVWPKVGRPS